MLPALQSQLEVGQVCASRGLRLSESLRLDSGCQVSISSWTLRVKLGSRGRRRLVAQGLHPGLRLLSSDPLGTGDAGDSLDAEILLGPPLLRTVSAVAVVFV